MEQLDDLDRRIIRCFQEEPRATNASIARITGVSETTIKRRAETLIESRVLTPAMIPDTARLGFTTPAFVGLTVDLANLDDIAGRLAGLPETTLVTATMGRFDLVVYVITPSLERLARLISAEIAALPGVRSTETFVTPLVYKTLKDWRLPVDELLDSFETESRISR